MKIASQSSLVLQYHQQPKMLDNYKISHIAKAVYTYLYSIYRNSNTISSDNIGEYLTITRETIASKIGVCIKTVIKYVKELVKLGLIKDRRLGVKEINRIYFCDVEDDCKYSIPNKEIETKTPMHKATHEATESDGLIKQVKNLISKVETINTKQAKQLIILSNGDINVIEKSLQYTLSKQYDNFMSYLCKCLRGKYYDVVDKPPQEVKTKQTTPNNSTNHNKFNKGYSHNFNYDLLEQKDQLLISLELGEISIEDYENKIKDLDK